MAWRRLGIYLVMAGGFFAAVAPTLRWQEFSGSLENLNIATALELRRDHGGDWLVPTLEGQQRIKKPPLTAWVTALAMRPATVAAMSSADASERNRAAVQLAWEARWPALLAACLMIIATCELGRIVADEQTGYLAGIVLGTTLMFLRFGRSAMIDVHLGLWVTVANVGLALAILRGARWSGSLLAGAALGLAFMSKGPVGLAQTILPLGVFGLLVWWRGWETGAVRGPQAGRLNGVVLPVVLGVVVMLLIALPWYVYIIKAIPEGWAELTRDVAEERGEGPSKWWMYLAILPYLLPWTVSFVGGVISARRGMILAACLAIVPLVAMSFYKDRTERYMYPVSGAAAVVAAHGVMTLARKRGAWNGLDKAAVAQHWVILVIIGIGLPALAATKLNQWKPTLTGEPWLTRGWGAGLTVAMGLVIAGGMLFRRRWMEAMVGTTVVVMLASAAAVMHGYVCTAEGRSAMRPLADAIWAVHPDARVLNAHPKGKRADVSLSIYLNRAIHWISFEDLERLKPGTRPTVVLMKQDPKEGPPSPPAGWEYVAVTKRDKDYWWGFVLGAEARIEDGR